MKNEDLMKVVRQFRLEGTVDAITPLGDGLINDTYLATTEPSSPDYVLQRINHAVFTDVELLQHNIEAVTAHLRRKLEAQGVADTGRRVLRFIPAASGKTYYYDGNNYWRMSVYIPDTKTVSEVTPQSSYDCGLAFGRFEQQLTDLQEPLGETIPDFHNMELRVSQLQQAVKRDAVGRVAQVRAELDLIERYADAMCLNNMLFDQQGRVLCVIDLDTVMPAYVFSDYGDFLRTAANTVAEDSPELDSISFRWDIFEAFTQGYLESTSSFLTPVEREHLPFAVMLFPMMQAVRFLTDYLNGDTYYKIRYAGHNLVRTRNQLRYFQCVEAGQDTMKHMVI